MSYTIESLALLAALDMGYRRLRSHLLESEIVLRVQYYSI